MGAWMWRWMQETSMAIFLALVACCGCGVGVHVHPYGALSANEAGVGLTVDRTTANADGTKTAVGLGSFTGTVNPQACLATVGALVSGVTDAVASGVETVTEAVGK